MIYRTLNLNRTMKSKYWCLKTRIRKLPSGKVRWFVEDSHGVIYRCGPLRGQKLAIAREDMDKAITEVIKEVA